MVPTVDYKALVQELRDRLTDSCTNMSDGPSEIWDGFRCRLASMLDDDPQAPLDHLLERLAEKWKRDGLL